MGMGTVTLELPEQQILQWVSQLSPVAKRELLEQLLIDIGLGDYASLTDEELIANAEDVFLELDKAEAQNE